MNSYYALTYLWIFLPVLLVLYQLCPQRYRWVTLLAGSYIFYWLFSGKLILYLLCSTLIIYSFGLWMDRLQKERKDRLSSAEKEEKKQIKARYQKKLRLIMLTGVLANLGILVVLKYTKFFGTNFNSLLTLMGMDFQFTIPHFLLPLGISFYTMQAMSYLIDVYRGTVQADRHPGRLALYMSFFPQIMEGPICRYSETALQLFEGKPVSYHSLTRGTQRIIYGCFKKMVIADHLNVTILQVFDAFTGEGLQAFIGAVCYTIQLYMEFSGTMDVVIGTAEIFGVRLTENFRAPFFSKTISEFWLRWHITLGAWFRDYIFYPVSVSKALKHRLAGFKNRFGHRAAAVLSGAVALFCVWICNGLWHGDDWQYLFFGMYHFTLILAGVIAEPSAEKLAARLHINRACLPYRLFQIVRTSLLVVIGELFFRAPSLSQGLSMFRAMITNFNLDSFSLTYLANQSLSKRTLLVLGIAVCIVFIVSLMQEKKVDPRDFLARQNVVIRWAVYYLVVFFIIIFGAYGLYYVPIDPIYANF